MTTHERLAFRISAVGTELIAAAARLREGGNPERTLGKLLLVQDRFELLRLATEALVQGDEPRCLQLVEAVAMSQRFDGEPARGGSGVRPLPPDLSLS